MEDSYWLLVFFFLVAPLFAAFSKRIPRWFRYGLAILLVLGISGTIIWLVLS